MSKPSLQILSKCAKYCAVETHKFEFESFDLYHFYLINSFQLLVLWHKIIVFSLKVNTLIHSAISCHLKWENEEKWSLNDETYWHFECIFFHFPFATFPVSDVSRVWLHPTSHYIVAFTNLEVITLYSMFETKVGVVRWKAATCRQNTCK